MWLPPVKRTTTCLLSEALSSGASRGHRLWRFPCKPLVLLGSLPPNCRIAQMRVLRR
jgi:hypothetical protein